MRGSLIRQDSSPPGRESDLVCSIDADGRHTADSAVTGREKRLFSTLGSLSGNGLETRAVRQNAPCFIQEKHSIHYVWERARHRNRKNQGLPDLALDTVPPYMRAFAGIRVGFVAKKAGIKPLNEHRVQKTGD